VYTFFTLFIENGLYFAILSLFGNMLANIDVLQMLVTGFIIYLAHLPEVGWYCSILSLFIHNAVLPLFLFYEKV
jgi:hypothetical protein